MFLQSVTVSQHTITESVPCDADGQVTGIGNVLGRRVNTLQAHLTAFHVARLGAFVQVQSPEDAKRVAACADTACSPLYRSPELYEPPTRGDLDSRVDVWALGCLLYFMMMRVNPFEKQCMQGASLVLAVQRAKVDWSEAPAYLHPDLKELVHACLRPKLQERPTCTELRQWIDRMKAWMGK